MAAQIAKTVRRATVSVFSCLFHGGHPMSSAVEGFGMLFYDILHRCDHCVDSDDILSLIILVPFRLPWRRTPKLANGLWIDSQITEQFLWGNIFLDPQIHERLQPCNCILSVLASHDTLIFVVINFQLPFRHISPLAAASFFQSQGRGRIARIFAFFPGLAPGVHRWCWAQRLRRHAERLS